MSVRQDKVQIQVQFITDESKQLAKTILDTKQLGQNLNAAQKELEKYRQEVVKAGEDELKRAAALEKVAAAEKKVELATKAVVAAGKEVERLDLSKVAPAQLIERAKQLQQALRFPPSNTEEAAQMRQELTRINTALGNLKTSSKGAIDGGGGGGFEKLAGVFTKIVLVGAAVVGLVRNIFAAFQTNAKLEQTNIAFETFLGNARAARTLIADLKAFEVKTPFEATQVFDAAKAFLAFGFSQKEVIPTLEKVGTVAAATGKDFNELALIYGKARAEGKIQNDTLGQLAEAGIPIYQELAKVLNVAESQIRKMAENGKINFKDLEKAFTNLTSEGGRFNGLLEAQSKSFEGILSTLTGQLKERLVGALSGVFEAIKDITKGISDFLAIPVSETLEKERQAFNGVTVSIYNAKEGTEQRTAAINELKKQYPQFLKDIDAEKVTNEQLKPILDKINNAYIVRIALQKSQEQIQPLLEQQAETELRLAQRRVGLNEALARGAELTGVNILAYKTEQEQLAAIQKALEEKVKAQGNNFSLTASQEAKALTSIKQFQSIVTFGQEDATFRTKKLTEAQEQQQKVVEQLKKTYGDLVGQVQGGALDSDGVTTTGGGGAGDPEKEKELREKKFKAALAAEEANQKKLEFLLENRRIKGLIDEEQYYVDLNTVVENALKRKIEIFKQYNKLETEDGVKAQTDLDNLQFQRQEFNEQRSVAILDDALRTQQDYEIKQLDSRRAQNKAIEELMFAHLEKINADDKKAKKEALKEEEEYQKRRQEILQQSIKAEADLFGLTADILEADEKNKKKNADVIKAFKKAEVTINSIAEIQAIYKNAQTSIEGGLVGPAAAYGLATVQAIVAAGRAALAINNIEKTKIGARGLALSFNRAKSGIFGGNSHATGGTKGWFSDGTQVEVEKDEAWAVVNKKNTPILRMLSAVNAWGGHGNPYFREGGVLRFEGGGLPNFNTTPTNTAPIGGIAFQSSDSGGIERAAEVFLTAAQMLQKTEIRARVSYLDVEDAGTTLDTIRNDASF